jgi:hypothetical protein
VRRKIRAIERFQRRRIAATAVIILRSSAVGEVAVIPHSLVQADPPLCVRSRTFIRGDIQHDPIHALQGAAQKNGITIMPSRLALFALAAILGFGSLVGSTSSSQAYTTDFRWANNTAYVNCVQGVNQRGQAMRPQMRGPYVADNTGRCNKMFSGR